LFRQSLNSVNYFEVHPNQVTAWKAQLLERSSEVFGEKADGTPAPNIEKMEAKIGRLTLENDFLESALVKAGYCPPASPYQCFTFCGLPGVEHPVSDPLCLAHTKQQAAIASYASP
jgi:hypothetical protein